MSGLKEATALAVLRCGRSYAEAAESSGLSVERVMEIWRMQSGEIEKRVSEALNYLEGIGVPDLRVMDAVINAKSCLREIALLKAEAQAASPVSAVPDDGAVGSVWDIVTEVMSSHISPEHGMMIGEGGCPCINWYKLRNELAIALTARVEELTRERDKWKSRWQTKADAFEVQEQSIAALQARALNTKPAGAPEERAAADVVAERHRQVEGERLDRLPASTQEESAVPPLPEPLSLELRSWLELGQLPLSGFLRAVLRNDLVNAVARATLAEERCLFLLVRWLICHAPEGSFGSSRVLSEWPMYLAALERQAAQFQMERLP